MKKKNILLIFLAIAAIMITIFIFLKYIDKNDVEKIDDEKFFNDFFEQIISIENFKLFLHNEEDRLENNFKEYCNDRGISVLFENRIVSYNYKYILKHDIQSYENLKVELLEESSDANKIFKDFKITYNYIDTNKNKYEMCDYYTINVIDNKIDYVKLNMDKSTVGKDWQN